MAKSFTITAALMKSWFKGQHRWRLPKHRATGPDGYCRSSANGFGAACGGIKTGRYGFMMLLSTSLAACLARRSLMMPDRQSGSCAQVREGRRRFRSKGDQIQASPIICQLGSLPPAAGLQSNGRDTSKSAAAKAFAAWGIYHSLASCLHRRGALRIDIFIGVWAFLLAYIWTLHIEPRQGGDRLQAVEIWERLKAAAVASCQSVPVRRTRSELSNRNISCAHAGCAVSTPLRFSPCVLRMRRPWQRGLRWLDGQSRRYICRSTIIRLISAMALVGLRPFGQALAQFMMVRQR